MSREMLGLLAAFLALPCAAEDSEPGRSSLFVLPAHVSALDRPACGKLDLICGKHRYGEFIELKPADSRFEGNAVTIRFGAQTESSPSKIEAQVGSFLNGALFLTALILFLI